MTAMPRSPILWLVLGAFAFATGVVLFSSRGGDEAPAAAPAPQVTTTVSVPTDPGDAVVADCSLRSMYHFGNEYENGSNFVDGPLVIGGAREWTSPSTIRGVGGNKYPVLLRPGHVATLQIPTEARSFAALGYGPLPQGEIGLDEAHDTVTFRPCGAGESSGSSAAGEPVTMWMGFIVTPKPACVPIDVYVDGSLKPRRVEVEHGVDCL
jgi:hypothetical protein